jgi:tetratricopeptide (TPR) repeat protein
LNMKKFLFLMIAAILLLPACAKPVVSAPTWQEQYDLGVRYLSEGNYEEAIIAFTAAIEIDPKQASAYVGRGDAYVLSGDTEETRTATIADYEKAIELDETYVEAYLGLADVYIRQGNNEKALEILNQALLKVRDTSSVENQINMLENQSSVQLSDIFERPLEISELTSNGLLVLDSTPENNSSAFLLNDRIYIVDESLQVRNLSRGTSKADVLQTVGFSQYGIECCNNLKDIDICIENKICTKFSETNFLDIDEAIIIEIKDNGPSVFLLLGFENGELHYLECDHEVPG